MVGLPLCAHSDLVTQHLPHLLMLALPVLVFAGVFALQWRAESAERLAPALWGAAAATVGSAAVHGGMTAHHAREAAVLGWAMALMCLAQLSWVVVLLLKPVRGVVDAGVLGNLSLVVLWTWTRLVGIPFGIAGGERQAVGAWDVTATLLEVTAVLAGLAWVGVRRPAPARALAVA